MNISEIERLTVVCKKINKLLKKHRNKLVRSKRLIKFEEQFRLEKIKYFFFFKLWAMGRTKEDLSRTVDNLNILIGDVERFCDAYKLRIRQACYRS